eukprot:TRINITY_DN9929_c0_g1_i2.p1 TRINITY_DN9929_c0_g1~~TRINITY_DN9929_c0_g1_i2.p1  ORF type:complete len:128 (+),score=15.74 TRINITY_DN9929_c0_g1_i2:832-1215(+)
MVLLPRARLCCFKSASENLLGTLRARLTLGLKSRRNRLVLSASITTSSLFLPFVSATLLSSFARFLSPFFPALVFTISFFPTLQNSTSDGALKDDSSLGGSTEESVSSFRFVSSDAAFLLSFACACR